jgi:hypothetical protein
MSIARARIGALRRRLTRQKSLRKWATKGFALPAPSEAKWAVLSRWGLKDAPWLETGTNFGQTTAILAKSSPFVVTLEPMVELYETASVRLKHHSNVEVIHASSEDGFAPAVERLGDRVNFWLDGHYSSGNTFRGSSATPIKHELGVISRFVQQGGNVAVFIDDVRLFVGDWADDSSATDRDGYPPLSFVVDWAQSLNLRWRIEHDIFVALSPPSTNTVG